MVKKTKMWYQREDIDEEYVLAYDANTLVELDQGQIGIWAGGEKVWVDYVLVYDAEGPSQLPVETLGKLTIRWAEVKSR